MCLGGWVRKREGTGPEPPASAASGRHERSLEGSEDTRELPKSCLMPECQHVATDQAWSVDCHVKRAFNNGMEL